MNCGQKVTSWGDLEMVLSSYQWVSMFQCKWWPFFMGVELYIYLMCFIFTRIRLYVLQQNAVRANTVLSTTLVINVHS